MLNRIQAVRALSRLCTDPVHGTKPLGISLRGQAVPPPHRPGKSSRMTDASHSVRRRRFRKSPGCRRARAFTWRLRPRRARESTWSRSGARSLPTPGGSRGSPEAERQWQERPGRGRSSARRSAPADGGERRARVGRVREVAHGMDPVVSQGAKRLRVHVDEGVAERRVRDEPGSSVGRDQAEEIEAEPAHLCLDDAGGSIHREDSRVGLVGQDVPVRGHGLEEPGSERGRRRPGSGRPA